MSALGFEFAGGSVPGRDHVGRSDILVGRNNQDAWLWKDFGDSALGVVCDGCGSGPHSEVGSAMLAQLVLRAVHRRYALYRDSSETEPRTLPDEHFWEAVRGDVLVSLDTMVRELHDAPDHYERTVQDYFLSTVLGVLVCPEGAFLFAIGDGVFVVNGEIEVLGPFPNNEPPYLAYGLLTRSRAPRFVVRHIEPLERITSLLIGTDGVTELIGAADRRLPGKGELAGSIDQFWTEARFFRNPDAVRRRLALMNSESHRCAPHTGCQEVEFGLLRDDTTLIVVRHAPPKEVASGERGLSEG